ncbi:MAG: SPFH domain-containing protein [Candidatus Eremiobacteraeota bacterium]|nr:SPFH domain-containing protein [Candidatus Eremiobacteraeota bacterium]
MFFRRITALPCESLLTIKSGKATCHGNGASTVIFPWDSYALVPTTAIEHTFQMHQESFDGITLRFKGIIIYRIVDVALAASLFPFTVSGGVEHISQAIGDICMGELRAIVAQMTMDECIRERKTGITEKLKDGVIPLIEGYSDIKGWGIKIDVLQVAQVFCPDERLLAQLQADARDKIRKTAQFSTIETNRQIEMTERETRKQLEMSRIHADIELSSQTNELEKVKLERKREYEAKKNAVDDELRLAELESNRVFDEKRIAAESKLKLQELEMKMEIAEKQLRLKEMETRLNQLDVESTALREKTMMEIRKEILPIEQLPRISENLSGLFKNSNLTFYGDQSMMLFNSLGEILGTMLTPPKKNGHKEEEAIPRN